MAENVEDYVARITAEDDASATIADIATKAEALSGTEAKVGLGADDAATPVIDSVEGEAGALDATEADVTLGAEDSASEVIESVSSGAADLAGTEANVALGAEDDASDTISGVAGAADELSGTSAEVSITADDEASDVIAGVISDASALEPITLEITADTGASTEQLLELGQLLTDTATQATELGQDSIVITVTTDEVDAAMQLFGDVGAEIQSISDSTITVNVDTSQLQAAGEAIQGLGGEADEAGVKAFKGTGKLKALGKALGGVTGIQGDANKAVSGIMAFTSTLEQSLPAASGLTSSVGGLGLAIGVAGLAFGVGQKVLESYAAPSKGISQQSKELGDSLRTAGSDANVFAGEIQKVVTEGGVGGMLTGLNVDAVDFANALSGDVTPELKNVVALATDYQYRNNGDPTGENRAVMRDMAAVRGIDGDAMIKQFGELRPLIDAYNTEKKTMDDAAATMEVRQGLLKGLVTNVNDTTVASIQSSLENKKNEESYNDIVEAVSRGIDVRGKSPAIIHAEVAAAIEHEAAVKAEAAAMDALRGSIEQVGGAWDTTASRATAFATASAALLPTTRAEVDAQIGWEAAVDNTTAAFEANGKTMDIHTEKGRANTQVVEAQGDAANKVVGQLVASGASYEDVAVKADGYRQTLTDTLRAQGLSDEAIHTMIHSMGLLPEQIQTRIELSGQEQAEAILSKYIIDVDSLPESVVTAYNAKVSEGDFIGAKKVLDDAANPGGAPRTAGITAEADTIQSDDDLATSASKSRTATIDAQAAVDKANASLELARAQDRVATLTAKAETAEASGDLKTAAAARSALITAKAEVGNAQAQLDALTRDATKRIFVTTISQGIKAVMAGGPINESGFYTVGEAGRETVYLPKGAHIDTAGQTMTNGSGGGVTIINNNFNVTVPLGASKAAVGAAIADALDAFYRTSSNRLRSA